MSILRTVVQISELAHFRAPAWPGEAECEPVCRTLGLSAARHGPASESPMEEGPGGSPSASPYESPAHSQAFYSLNSQTDLPLSTQLCPSNRTVTWGEVSLVELKVEYTI